MSRDARHDVVVIGAGAGGAAVAWGLCRRGLSVLLLDAGPRFDPAADYPQTEADWDLHDFPEKPGSKSEAVLAPAQTFEVDEPLLEAKSRGGGRDPHPRTRSMYGHDHVRGIGGSTLHFTGEAHRLHPSAMRMKSRFGAAGDWPIDYAELEPYYAAAEALIGVAGPSRQGARWRSGPFPLPPHPLSYAAQTLGKGAAKLGVGWEANSRAALSMPYNDRPPCNHCGGCNKGCPIGDKGSADVTFIAAAVATGRCTVRPDTQVVKIEKGSDDRIAGVIVGKADGSLERIAAPLIVLAAGAVESPRLLLASDQLCNESGQVGRNFIESPWVLVSALHPDPQHGRRGLPSDAICWDFNAPDAIPGIIGGCRFYNASAEMGLMSLPDFALRAVAGWGREHAQSMRRLWGHQLSIGAFGETLPNDHAHVALDTKKRDRFGMPLARLTPQIEPGDIARLRFMASKAREILVASGAEDVFETYSSWGEFSPSHVFGTCRMGSDPDTSVVRGDLRSHRWRNLWITDASVFPSSGGGEAPTLTIQALALRAAQHMGRD